MTIEKLFASQTVRPEMTDQTLYTLSASKSFGENLEQCSHLSIEGTGGRTNEHTLQNKSYFIHKYETQRQMRQSLVNVSKAFDHATFSTLKNRTKKKQTNTKNH